MSVAIQIRRRDGNGIRRQRNGGKQAELAQPVVGQNGQRGAAGIRACLLYTSRCV